MKKSIVFLSAVVLLTTACSNLPLENEEEDKIIQNVNSEIVLGDVIENPFSVSNLEARGLIVDDSNYIYFRCRSNNEEEVKWLTDQFGLLTQIPLDREIEESGTIYIDPEIPEGECPWFYFMKPKEDYELVKEKGFQLEVLDEMYVSDEDYSLITAEGLDVPENADYGEMELDDSSRSFLSKIMKRFKIYYNRPKGYVTVYDTFSKKNVPVRNVTVMSQQLLLFWSDKTNSEGKFSIPLGYTSILGNVQIHVVFENNKTIINGAGRWDQYLVPAFYIAGSYNVKNISKLKINLGCNTRQARLGTIINAYEDYHAYCAAFNITKPGYLRTWVWNDMSNCCAPLARHAAGGVLTLSGGVIASIMGNPVGAGLLSAAVLSTFLPDIVIGVKDCTSENFTELIYKNVFHELSHASHFFGIGDLHAQMIWLQEYIEMAGGWLNAIVHGKSPIDTPYAGDTDLIRLVETWGYFDEYHAMMWRFSLYREKYDEYKQALEERKIKGDEKKIFSYSGFYKLTTGEGALNVYSVTQIFNALKSPSVKSLNSFAEKLADKDDVNNVKRIIRENMD